MAKVHFRPWIGKDYLTQPHLGKRVLILGESHYQWDKDVPLDTYHDLTIDCIREIIDGKSVPRFWTHIAIAFLGRKPDQTEKSEFWHSVAFYNFIQQSVGFGARVRPTDEMWTSSLQPLLEVLDDLKPQAVVVLGYQLWSRVKGVTQESPLVLADCPQPATRLLSYSSGRSLAYGIRHPSSGFNGRDWYPHISKVLESA